MVSGVCLKMLAGPRADHTEHRSILRERDRRQLTRRGEEEAPQKLAVSTGGGDYD